MHLRFLEDAAHRSGFAGLKMSPMELIRELREIVELFIRSGQSADCNSHEAECETSETSGPCRGCHPI